MVLVSRPRELDDAPTSGKATVAKVGDMSISGVFRGESVLAAQIGPSSTAHLQTKLGCLAPEDFPCSLDVDQSCRPTWSIRALPRLRHRSHHRHLLPWSVLDLPQDQTLGLAVMEIAVWWKGVHWRIALQSKLR